MDSTASFIVYLVVVLHQLDDDSDVITVVFDGDDSHDVGGILSIRVWTVFVCQYQARICFMNLNHLIYSDLS